MPKSTKKKRRRKVRDKRRCLPCLHMRLVCPNLSKPAALHRQRRFCQNKLVDVQKKESLSKASWPVDVDVKAPIVIISEEVSTSPDANVMVFGLDDLEGKCGKGSPTCNQHHRDAKEELPRRIPRPGGNQSSRVDFRSQIPDFVSGLICMEMKGSWLIPGKGIVAESITKAQMQRHPKQHWNTDFDMDVDRFHVQCFCCICHLNLIPCNKHPVTT